MVLIEKLPLIKGKYRENVSLAKICWFQVGGNAEVLYVPESLEDLSYFLQARDPKIPLFIFGVGSNILVRDAGISGVVIRLGRAFNYIYHNNQHIIAGAAALDLNVAFYAMENEMGGLEFFSGIPGTIGGALAMNAGAYGMDTASILIEATAINMEGKVKVFSVNEIGYYYRGNKLSNDWIFLEAKFRYHSGKKEKIASMISEIQAKRADTQPIKARTGGSTFKNHSKYKAWELIDQAGLRGYIMGGAQISEKHCNFLINTGQATSNDIENLMRFMKAEVFEKTGVLLEEEIKIIGREA